MPINWSSEMDRKLLLAILKVHDFPIDKMKVAEELSNKDQPCTSMAIQKRLQAIKTMIKDGSGEDSTPKVKATPRKRGAAAAATKDKSPTKKAKSGKGKGTKTKATEESDGDGEGAEQHTVKEEGVEEDKLTF